MCLFDIQMVQSLVKDLDTENMEEARCNDLGSKHTGTVVTQVINSLSSDQPLPEIEQN